MLRAKFYHRFDRTNGLRSVCEEFRKLSGLSQIHGVFVLFPGIRNCEVIGRFSVVTKEGVKFGTTVLKILQDNLRRFSRY